MHQVPRNFLGEMDAPKALILIIKTVNNNERITPRFCY